MTENITVRPGTTNDRETIDHPPYIPTRAFYEKMGFEKGEAREIISTTCERLELVMYYKNLGEKK